jgi:outer membrane protein TolC
MYRLAALLLPFALFAQIFAQSQALPEGPLSLSEAIESTLREHPLLHAQEQQVVYSLGAALRAQAQFDRTVSAGASLSRTYTPLSEVERTLYGATSATTNFTSIDVDATQQFHNGISAGPLLNVTRTTDNVFTVGGLNLAHIGFQVNIPLLRGRGRDVVGAQETAGGIEVEASLLDLNQTVSDLLFNTAVAYWSTVAARRSREVYSEAEARGKIMLDTVRTLIEADKIPRSDVSEVQANLADRTASRIAADQQLLQAKQQLAVAMGLSAESMFSGREATDPLPAANAPVIPQGGVQAAIAQALGRRADYLAAKKRQGAADLLAGAAKNQLKPQLDLQFSTGLSGLKDGARPDQYILSTIQGVHGVDATGGIRYQFPLENRAAEGNVLQTRSTAVQAAYRAQDSARNIASAVIVAVEGVRSAALQLEKVNQSVTWFQTALDNEREKYRLGVGSLVEVLTVEDRLTGALVAQVQAELGYAVALARLRHGTGTIVEPDKAAQRVDPAVFLGIPAMGPAGPPAGH